MTRTYQCKYIRCGKANCKSCPHGPYWYAYWKQGGKTKCEYVGKVSPFVEQHLGKKADHDYDKILNPKTATVAMAWQILQMKPTPDGKAALRQYRELSRKYHPDAGGDHKSFVWLSAAWTYLKSINGWK